MAPLKTIVSKPSWPSSDVVVVARVPDEDVVAGAHQGEVVAVAAVDEVVAFRADQDVVAEPAVHGQLDAVGLEAGGVDHVVAAEAVDDEPVVGLLLVEDADLRPASPKTPIAAGIAGDADDVGAVGPVDRHRVGRAVAAAVRAAQVDVDLGDVGAAEVADR